MPRPSTGRTFNGGNINVAFINIESYNISQQRPDPTPRHTIYAFLISSLFNFLQLKYQANGSPASPFQTHPKTMWVAVSSSLLYCFAYSAEHRPGFTQLARSGMGLFGSILFASLASVLFRNSVSFVLYSLYVLFLNRETLCSAIEVFRRWNHGRKISDTLGEIQLIDRRWIVIPASVNSGGGLLPV